MKVLIVNTSERTGGAAVAAKRLLEALNGNGVKAKMLVGTKESDHISVAQIPHQKRLHWNFLWERLCIWVRLRFQRRHLFEVDMANAGCDITKLPEFREADIIHLHWINQGTLSLNGIRRILESGKPVVWTMHDLWPATGICHYARTCSAFRTGCHNCQLLPAGGSANDLSRRVWTRKKRLYHNSNIHFVTCSRWLEEQAKQSALFVGQRVTSVPNTIDTRMFCPGDSKAARLNVGLPAEGRIILFVSQKVTDERKGMEYFIDAIDRLVKQHPELKDNTSVAVLGGNAQLVCDRLALKAYPLGYVSDERRIVDIYRSADMYVLPSLEDNLPNTIMEAMACGVPCVGFRVGGIPEMIDHRRTGYVANFKDSNDLAVGMNWVLQEADTEQLSSACVSKVTRCYSGQSVAMRYIEVYNELIALKRYIV